MVNMDKNIKIAFVEDNQVFFQALKILLLENKNFDLVGMFSNAESLIRELSFTLPDVVIMDLDLPGMSGIEAIQLIKKQFTSIKILVLTVHDDEDRIFKSLRAGADGYLLKKNSLESLDEKIYTIINEGSPISVEVSKKVLSYFQKDLNLKNVPELKTLTEKELEILELISEGHLNKEIADKMFTSIDSVKKHVQMIYEKLNVRNRSEAINMFLTGK